MLLHDGDQLDSIIALKLLILAKSLLRSQYGIHVGKVKEIQWEAGLGFPPRSFGLSLGN